MESGPLALGHPITHGIVALSFESDRKKMGSRCASGCFRGDEDVAGLQVAVEDSVVMCFVQCAGNRDTPCLDNAVAIANRIASSCGILPDNGLPSMYSITR